MIINDHRSYRMTSLEFSIGSDATCDLVLSGDNIEPIHAQVLMMSDEHYVLRAYHQAHVMVNQQLVRDSVTLQSGDIVTIGHTTLRFELEQQAGSNQVTASEGDIIEGEFQEVTLSTNQLIVAPPSKLFKPYESRIGCAYCFRTLDPEDPDETLREAVKHKNKPYHRKCWEQLPQHDEPVSEYVPPKPTPLRVVQLIPSPLYMGPLNALDNVPLGISESVVILTSNRKAEVYVRNNSEGIILLDRRKMPMWAYIDYGEHDLQDANVSLMPGQMRQLTIYPHRIRPGMGIYYLDLTATQGVNIENQSGNGWPTIMFIVIYTLFLWHVSTIFQLHNWLDGGTVRLQYVIEPLLTLFLLFGSLFLLAPARLLWQIFDLIQKAQVSSLRPVLAPAIEPLKMFVMRQLRNGDFEDAMRRFVFPFSLKLLGSGLAGAFAFFLPTFILVSILGSFLSTLVVLIECGMVLYILYVFGKGYGFDLLTFIEQLVRIGRSVYRELEQQISSSERS